LWNRELCRDSATDIRLLATDRAIQKPLADDGFCEFFFKTVLRDQKKKKEDRSTRFAETKF
jgi:hypothetical protein